MGFYAISRDIDRRLWKEVGGLETVWDLLRYLGSTAFLMSTSAEGASLWFPLVPGVWWLLTANYFRLRLEICQQAGESG